MINSNRNIFKEEFMTTGEVAKYCQVTSNGVKKWISEGKLKAFQTPGGHFRIFKNDFKEFLEATKFPIDYQFFGLEMKKILVVDDEPAFIHFAVDTIKAMNKSYSIESAEDGYEALIKIGAFKPDLLILDIMMPNINGIEVLRRIKENRQMEGLKILIVTAFMEKGKQVLQEGADDFLLKPVPVSVLQKKVENLLGDTYYTESAVSVQQGLR